MHLETRAAGAASSLVISAGVCGALDPRLVMRDTIPAAALMVAGMELFLASFLLSVLRYKESG